MIKEIGQRAHLTAKQFALATTEQKNCVLLDLSNRLSTDSDSILESNALDIEDGIKAGLTDALIDRLRLTPYRLQAIADDIRNVTALLDPVGECFDAYELLNGLQVHKQRVPIGVIGVIYEARPNVTVDVAGLAIKTGNV